MTESVEILLVEDNPSDAEMTMRALGKHNLANNVHVATDGQQALDYVFSPGSGPSPRLVILDLKLPKVSGLEVLATMKGDPRTKSIPVVVLTSSKEERDLFETYDLGTNSYIVKPVRFETFASTVAELGYYWMLLNSTPRA